MKEVGIGMTFLGVGLIIIIGFVYGAIYAFQPLKIYIAKTYTQTIVLEKEALGRAMLLQAENGRKVAIESAKAKSESAKYEAEAEVTRAGGVAKANKIIGDSLKDNEGYLRYLWINQLSDNKQNVIYIPTETGMPILEAGRR